MTPRDITQEYIQKHYGECADEWPDSEVECSHRCDLPVGHEGSHSFTFTWPAKEDA